MAKLRKGDTVVVIAGKDKGKQGTILAVKADRVKVQGVNIVTKHQKPNQVLGKEGAIVNKKLFTHFKCCNLQCSNPKSRPYCLSVKRWCETTHLSFNW